MPLLKILNESYRNEDALENLIYYVCRSGHVGGVGVDPEYALMQMSLVKRLWHKEAGRQMSVWGLGCSQPTCSSFSSVKPEVGEDGNRTEGKLF